MTHPSHHLNFGMNPDHARNSLSNCGIRQPKYGDRKVHHMHMRKKGPFGLQSPILFCAPCCKLNPRQEWFPRNCFILSVFTASWLICNDIYFEHSIIIRVNAFLRRFNFSYQIMFKVTKLIKLVHIQVRLEWDE